MQRFAEPLLRGGLIVLGIAGLLLLVGLGQF